MEPSRSATPDGAPAGTTDRTVRDVVALSMLPAIWLGAEPVRIVESLAASLYTVLEADVVYVALHGDAEHGEIAVAQTGRTETDAALAGSLSSDLRRWVRDNDPDDIMVIGNPRGAGTLQLLVRPLAINAEYGLIAAGFVDAPSSDRRHQLLMNVAATQATTAIDNVRLLRSVRRYAAQQRAAVEQAELAKVAAEAANGAKDEFLAMLGHELRNPLAPIQTALQLMRLRGDVSAERERAVIERQVKHLTRLVDDLLDVSRVARGKVELELEPVDMTDVVAKGIELASPVIEERRHTLDVDVPKGLVVDGDLLRLSQVVSNLLANAAKYTEPGGHLTVMAEPLDDHVLLRVRDTGSGITPDMLPRVFDLFVQQRQTLERSQGGLGLGLTIVRSIVQMHGGTVSAHSEGPGRGAEFVVRLPISELRAASVAGVPPATAAPSPVADVRPDVRILVVDDNDDAATMLAFALRQRGFQVRDGRDGPTAISIAQEFKPHIALLDIGLPVMDGYELGLRLRQLPGTGAMRLCAITGYAQEADRERSRAAGFDRHFAKPLNLEVLEQALRELASATLRQSSQL